MGTVWLERRSVEKGLGSRCVQVTQHHQETLQRRWPVVGLWGCWGTQAVRGSGSPTVQHCWDRIWALGPVWVFQYSRQWQAGDAGAWAVWVLLPSRPLWCIPQLGVFHPHLHHRICCADGSGFWPLPWSAAPEAYIAPDSLRGTKTGVGLTIQVVFLVFLASFLLKVLQYCWANGLLHAFLSTPGYHQGGSVTFMWHLWDSGIYGSSVCSFLNGFRLTVTCSVVHHDP